MSEIVYHIELDDYATPAFVTFGKDYYGTMADVEEFISKFKDDDERQDLVKAFEEYKQGKRSVFNLKGCALCICACIARCIKGH